METKAFFAEKGRLKISMQALPMGKDWCFIVTGGELPHLGAVSAGGCTFAFAGHKEDAVTHRMCEAFGKKLPMNVAVCSGIHLDNISREEIADTLALCDELAEKFIESYFAEEKAMKIVVGITGATGVIYGIKLLEKLKTHTEVSTVLVMSEWAEKTIALETDYTAEYVRSLADEVCSNGNMAEGISSGSYKVDATVIIPCTVKTLSAIAHGYDAELIVRAADVALKEHRKLIICPRETPLNEIHLENMAKLARMGAYVVPPMPSFYHRPQTVDDIVEQFACRVMELCEIEDAAYRRWKN